MKDEKLQKALARMGLGSRRQMEEVIKAGRAESKDYSDQKHERASYP